MDLPAGYAVRPPLPEDGPPIVAMLNEETLALAGVATASLDWVAAPWTAPGADLEGDFAVIVGPAGDIAGYFFLESEPPHAAVFAVGCVGLRHHGRGVGGAMLSEIERRARLRAAGAPGDAPILRVGALTGEPHVSALLEARGFREVRRFWAMRIFFAQPPRPPAPVPGVELRTFRPADEAAVYACLAEAFADHWGGDFGSREGWAHRHIHAAESYDAGLWRIAWEGGEVVGALVAELRSQEDPRLGHVELLGVRRAARGRGIGEALLRSAFVAFAERGQDGANLHVDSESVTGATRLYERVGMTAEPRFSTWQKPLRPAA